MKIYIAAPYSQMLLMRPHRDALHAAGHNVTARWIDGNEEGMTLAQAAQMDLDDIDAADCLLAFTLKHKSMFSGGGRYVEFGYALAKGKRLAVVGGLENVFLHLPQVEVYRSIQEFLAK